MAYTPEGSYIDLAVKVKNKLTIKGTAQGDNNHDAGNKTIKVTLKVR